MISTSKIKKIIAIKKKWREKGIRKFDLGSNPHSKEEFFSRSEIIFFDKIEAINIMIHVINNIIIEFKNKILIIYTIINIDLLIGS